ncbi:hypothetical protein ADL06_24440 [Streptomyces sp. NRRL F-6491]|nr:hypothetical protein ADL06_24440 [Streptomyces sp. NRRL F-6491]KOX38757.1 hypothetical protein ADL08_26775 [Streptomyces sp. NRRL F-6492]
MGVDPRRVPFIKPAVFLHDSGLVSGLDEFQQINVFGRNDGASGLGRVWDDLLGKPPERESRRITPQSAQLLEQLMQNGPMPPWPPRSVRWLPPVSASTIAGSGSGKTSIRGSGSRLFRTRQSSCAFRKWTLER